MSKKLLAVLLVVSMLFALCACAKTPEPEEPAFPETLTDADLTVAEGLPVLHFDGTWKKVEKTEQGEGEEFETLAFYENQDPDAFQTAFSVYTWEKTLSSLKEEAENSRKTDYPNQEYLTLYEGTFWEKEGDFNYIYYCAFNEITLDDYTYCQAYFFEVDNTIYELNYFIATEAVPFGDTGLQFYGPKCVETIELSETDIENGMVASRHNTYTSNGGTELCNFDLHVFDKGEDTIETATQYFYDIATNVISVEPYTFTSRLGSEYEGMYVVYEDVYDGVAYYNKTYCELVGDKFIAVNCYVPLEGMDPYTMACTSAMSHAIFGY